MQRVVKFLPNSGQSASSFWMANPKIDSNVPWIDLSIQLLVVVVVGLAKLQLPMEEPTDTDDKYRWIDPFPIESEPNFSLPHKTFYILIWTKSTEFLRISN